MTIRGSVDSITSRRAVGWVAEDGSKEALFVNARFQGRIIGQAIADRPRPDLAAAGIGDGDHGFEIEFGAEIDSAVLPAITIHADESDAILPRTNLTGLFEFLTPIINSFPAAGRSRSVFGGLWVDRSDALRVLVGRVAAGATPPKLEEPLRDFIINGLVKMSGTEIALNKSLLADVEADVPLDAMSSPAAQKLMEALPEMLFGKTALPMLQALLDDIPRAISIVPIMHGFPSFAQPSTAEALPSPGECVLVVLGAGLEIDIVRKSHELPEFNALGQSRWISPKASVAIDLAIQHGASVDTVLLDTGDIALIDPGTLYRIRGAGGGVAVWCVPLRLSPQRFLAQNEGRFQLRHKSGALIAA